MKLRDKEDPQEILTRLEDLTYELSELGTVPESVILQYFLEGLPDKYHLEKQVLAGEALEGERLVTRIRGRYQSLKESQIIPGEALVVKDRTYKKPTKDNRPTGSEG